MGVRLKRNTRKVRRGKPSTSLLATENVASSQIVSPASSKPITALLRPTFSIAIASRLSKRFDELHADYLIKSEKLVDILDIVE